MCKVFPITLNYYNTHIILTRPRPNDLKTKSIISAYYYILVHIIVQLNDKYPKYI